MNNPSKKFLNTKQIAILSLVFAIMIISLILFPINAFIPLVALIVIAQTGDVKLAGLGGLMFGIASFLSALLIPRTVLYFAFLNPMVSIIPRIIVGVMVFVIYKATFSLIKQNLPIKSPSEIALLEGNDKTKAKRLDYISLTVAAISGALINTVLVLGMMFLFYVNHPEHGVLIQPIPILIAVGPSALTEPIVCAILAPPIVTALKHVR